MNRRGVTLLELLLGLVLLALVGVAMTSTLMATSRTAVRSTQALAITRTLVATGALTREELGNSDTAEVRLQTPTAADFGRTVGSSVVCDAQDSVVRIPAAEWLGARQPEGGRDAAVLLTDVPSGRWVAVPIVSVGAGPCPDGSTGIVMTLGSAVGPVAFVRVIEPVELRAYLSGGDVWWGLAPASGLSPVQPFAGPLASPLPVMTLSATGLLLSFRPLRGAAAELRVPLEVP